MTLGFLGACIAKDLRRIRRDPLGLLLSLSIPLVVAFLMRLAFGGGGAAATPTAHLLVADHDESLVSGFLVGAMNQGPLADLIAVETVTEETGRARMAKGDASALLIIPERFGDTLLQNEPTVLRLITNPAQTILPGIVEEALSLMVDAAFYLQQIAGEPMRAFAAGPPAGANAFADSTLIANTLAINRTVERIVPYVSPPVLALETPASDEPAEPGLNLGALFLPGMLLMGLLFVGQGLSDDFWKEKGEGTLRRAAVTPGGLFALLVGKTLAAACVLGLASLVGLLAAVFLFDVPVFRPVLGWAWLALSGTALFLLFTLIQFFATSARGGNVLTTVILFPAIMVGGSFFPFEAMPEWLAAIGRLTPNGWVLVQFKAILAGESTASGTVPAALLVLAFSAVLLSLCWVRLRGPFLRA